MYSLRQLKHNIKSRLPESGELFFRLLYNIIRKPNGLKSHLNRLHYEMGLLRKPDIDFVPPVFVATITDNCNLRCPTCLYLIEDPDKFTLSYIRPDKLRQLLENIIKKGRQK